MIIVYLWIFAFEKNFLMLSDQCDGAGAELVAIGCGVATIAAPIDIRARPTRSPLRGAIPPHRKLVGIKDTDALAVENRNLVVGNAVGGRHKDIVGRSRGRESIGERQQAFGEKDNAGGRVGTSGAVGFELHLEAVAHPRLHLNGDIGASLRQ